MRSTTTREVTITADPTLPVVRIVREFDAPPDKVFRAHADPDLVVQWLGPRAVTMKIDSWDFRTLGSYRYSAVDSDGNPQTFRGCRARPSSRPSPGKGCPTVWRSSDWTSRTSAAAGPV
jgi:hypothetical protein